MEKKEKSIGTEEKKQVQKSKYKSELIKTLVQQVNNKKLNKINDEEQEDTIKEENAIHLSDILIDIDTMSNQDIKNIYEDINAMQIKVGIDSKAINLLLEMKDNENVKNLLQNIDLSMDIDINSISELRKSNLDIIRSMGCKIGKVYVNSGWDQAAEKGYSLNKYEKIATNAEKMLQMALKKLPENASQRDKFMAIYNAVLRAEHYDYSALSKNNKNKYTSRSLEGFFIKGSSVCAGTADALKNLCECAGIEVQYVQGMAKSKHEKKASYHAWIKVKIDGKWYNADPTWDANKVGRKYEFCLKSDKDFYGHTEDREYNPTYRRDTYSKNHRRTGETRTYKKSEESFDSALLEDEYYEDEFDRKKIEVKQVSESYLEYATKYYEPIYKAQNTKLTFKQKLAEFLSKRKHLKGISFIKKFIEKNSVKKVEKGKNNPKTVSRSYSTQETRETNAPSIQRIPKNISQRYLTNITAPSEKRINTKNQRSVNDKEKAR